jgi:hypothetical protein
MLIELNRAAMRRMRAPVPLEIVPGACAAVVLSSRPVAHARWPGDCTGSGIRGNAPERDLKDPDELGW